LGNPALDESFGTDEPLPSTTSENPSKQKKKLSVEMSGDA